MFNLRLVDPHGVLIEASSGENGIIGQDTDLLISLDGWTGGVGVRSEKIELGTHGNFPTPTLRSGRVLTMSIQVYRDNLEAWDREISGLFSDGGFASLEVTGGGITLETTVQLDGEVKTVVNLDNGWATAEIPLHASDPFLYGEDRTTFLIPSGMGVGLRYPLYGQVKDSGGNAVLSYGTAVSTRDPVANAGNAPAWPVIVVVGDWSAGFDLSVGDRVISWPHPTAPQSPVEIDMRGKIRVGGMDQTQMASRRDWSSIPPRGEIYPVLTPVQAGSGWAEVHVRDTYL